MNNVQLGQSGLIVSDICLGTMTFSREADKATSFEIMDTYLEHGGFFLDTANVYSNGASEETVGAWIAERGNRDQIVLATKVFGRMSELPNGGGLSRRHITTEVENSLRRLKTDVIDLYQIHRWYTKAPLEETARALDDLVRAGKVRYIGCSNLRGYQLALYLSLQQTSMLERFVCIQPPYNAVNRAVELEVLPLAEREGLGVIPYNPLAGGLLTGKYNSADAASDSRLNAYQFYNKRYHSEQALKIAEQFVAHARELGMRPAQLALAWVRSDPRITAPIVGARNVEQLTDTLGALERGLSVEEREAVPAVESGRWVGEDPVYDTTPYK